MLEKWFFALLLLAALLAGCGQAQPPMSSQSTTAMTEETQPPERAYAYTVGVCLPDQSDYWSDSARELTAFLTALDCDTVPCYAQGDVKRQQEQLAQLVEDGADCLVVAAIDSVALVEVLEDARSAGIPVVAYDRLLMDTEVVSAYVAFDYEAMGAAMGQYIVENLGLEHSGEESVSHTAELLMGSADDNSAMLLHRGLMAVLEPHFASGALTSRTGRTSFEDTYILRWEQAAARQQCAQYLRSYYTDEGPELLIAASDELAQGCIEALQEAGFTEAAWPVITGQGAGGTLQIREGLQAMSLWKDTRLLAEQCAQIVAQLLSGQVLQAEHTIDNHVRSVPTFYCAAALVDENNCHQVTDSN